MNKLKLHRGAVDAVCRPKRSPDRVVSLACKFCEGVHGRSGAPPSFFRALLDLRFFHLFFAAARIFHRRPRSFFAPSILVSAGSGNRDCRPVIMSSRGLSYRLITHVRTTTRQRCPLSFEAGHEVASRQLDVRICTSDLSDRPCGSRNQRLREASFDLIFSPRRGSTLY